MAAGKKVIYDYLAAKFSTVLMIDDEDLSPDKALGAYGTDSFVGRGGIAELDRAGELEATVILMDLLADNALGRI